MEDHSNHLFSEDEIGQILNRASVLQSNAGGRTYSGLTIKELEEIAREADIDPRFISAAASELIHLNEKDKSNLWGGPTKLVLRRHIKGQVSEKAWKRMVTRMETRFGKPGEMDQWDNTREWVGKGKKGVLANLVLHEHDGYTKMELLWDNQDIVTPFLFLALAPLIAFPITIAIILEGIGATGFAAFGLVLLITLLFGFVSRMGFGKKQQPGVQISESLQTAWLHLLKIRKWHRLLKKK